MTRTARRKAKREALPATPWEELRGGTSEPGDSSEEKTDLRPMKKNEIHFTISERTKNALRRQTGKSLKRTLSDTVQLIESNVSSSSSSAFPETTSDHETTDSTSVAEDRKKKMKLKNTTSTLAASKTLKPMLNGAKRKVLGIKRLQMKRRKKRCEDTVHLLSHSDDEPDSDGTTPSHNHTAISEELWEEDENKESSEDPNITPEVDQENDNVAKNVKKKAKGGNKGSSARVKIGNRWMKAQPPVQDNGNNDGETGGKGGRDGATRKRKRPMDEERRQKRIEQRRLRRQRKKVCFNCRQPGHQVGECPSSSAGICFKCGSSEHSCQQCKAKVPPGEFPYAKCFICGEMGHLTRSCPDNPRGLYPRGGGCKICGSVEHLKTNCPEGKSTSTSKSVSGQSGTATAKGERYTISSSSASADALDDTQPLLHVRTKPKTKRKGKVVVF